MRIIFDSEKQMEMVAPRIIAYLADSPFCPAQADLDECCNSENTCEFCWRNAINIEKED